MQNACIFLLFCTIIILGTYTIHLHIVGLIMNYSVDIMEIATEHAIDHVVDRAPSIRLVKTHAQKYKLIIMCFATPIEILTRNGIERGEPGDCIIIAPSFPEYHCTVEGEEKGFVNDWLHVEVNNIPHLEEMDPPFNVLIKTNDPMFLRKSIELIQHELLYSDLHYERLISNCIEQMIIDLSRAFSNKSETSLDSEYKAQLLELKNKMQHTLHEPWTVDLMAKHIGLSTSRLSVIYRKQFNSSPMDDIIEMRIRKAKHLLASTKLTMKQIALRCGMKNEYYFSRLFKTRVGVAPSVYRGK